MVSKLQVQREKIYSALCMTLSQRIDQVDWDSFSQDDWTSFANLAEVEGTAPLIHWTFKHIDTSGIDIPETVKAQIKVAYYNTTAQNQLMFLELERILGALAKAGIPVIVLKGSALAATIYPEIGLRPMVDLDLLIPRHEMDKAEHLMRGIEYTEAWPLPSSKLNRKIGYHIELKGGPKEFVNVEIHWSLVAGDEDHRSAPIDWFWENTIPWQEYSQAFTLSPTVNLLFLCAHLMLQHGVKGSRLIWFVDIDKIVRAHMDSLDWSNILQQANENQWEAALYYALLETISRLNTPVPVDIFDPNRIDNNQVTTTLVQRKSQLPRTPTQKNLTYFLGLKSSVRLHYLLVKLFPNPAFIRWRYKPKPRWTWPLFYPYRWLRIAIELIDTI